MTIEQLKKLVAKTPDTPGVYRFQNAKHEDIYIGKAASIKKRLASYIKTTDPRIRKMIDAATGLTHTETESDIEALILESQLIKQKRPQFNIMLRDDKQYFFVGFSKDKFPRLFLTHQPSARSNASGPRPGEPVPSVPPKGSPSTTGSKGTASADFVGPFTDGVALKSTLKYLRSIFPYCTCKQKHHNFCLNFHIGKCLGICCLKEPTKIPNYQLLISNYQQNIKAIRDILTGRRSSLVKDLKKEMEIAGKDHDFAKAIELRTKLERLERVFYNAQVIKNSEILHTHNSGLQKLLKIRKPLIRIEGYDISNIQGSHATGSMVTFVNGMPDKNFYRKFNIKTVHGANDTAMLREILERRLSHIEWPYPDLILIDGGKSQVSSTLKILKEMNTVIPLIGLSKDDKHAGKQLIVPGRNSASWRTVLLEKLPAQDRNLVLSIDAEAHRFAIAHYRHLHRKLFR